MSARSNKTMQLLIMRHGIAETTLLRDAERPLSSSGWQQTVAIGRWLQQQIIISNTVALVSPYQRTQQTFAALKSVLPQLIQQPHTLDLTPKGQADTIINQLQHDPNLQQPTLLIISHIPLINELMNQLCPHAGTPSFLPAMIAAVEFTPQNAQTTLQWLKTPPRC